MKEIPQVKTRVLTQGDVNALLDMALAVDAVEAAFAAHGRSETQMPVKVYLDLPKYDGDFRAMPAYYDGSAGVKWVNAHPLNPQKHGLPTVLGMYILSDPDTAQPLAVMDATLLTAARTGAAAAVASKHLARRPERVGFVGSGVQARTMTAALRAVYEDFEILASDRDEAAASRFADEVGGHASTVEEAAGCDIVCTATPSREPVVRREWIRDGAHINAMGADAHGKQELEPRILLDAKIVLDDWQQAGESGEVNVSLAQGVLEPDQILRHPRDDLRGPQGGARQGRRDHGLRLHGSGGAGRGAGTLDLRARRGRGCRPRGRFQIVSAGPSASEKGGPRGGRRHFDARRVGASLKRIERELAGTKPPVVTLIAEAERDPFKVLISTILSARTKDEVTAESSARLFAVAPTAAVLAGLTPSRIEKLIFPVGFYRTKAKNVRKTAKALLADFDGVVPDTIDELVTLPGVGRKTANLVLTEGFQKPAICVDTHVHRISNLWGFIDTQSPDESEMALRELLPRRYWIDYNKTLVSFGQQICTPMSPWCSRCPLADWCPRIGVERVR